MAERDRPAKPVILSLLIAFASMLVVSLAGIAYTGHVASESNKQWCKVLISIDDAFAAAASPTPAGKRIAGEFHSLRVDFGC